MAQLGARLHGMQEVASSSLVNSTTILTSVNSRCLFCFLAINKVESELSLLLSCVVGNRQKVSF